MHPIQCFDLSNFCEQFQRKNAKVTHGCVIQGCSSLHQTEVVKCPSTWNALPYSIYNVADPKQFPKIVQSTVIGFRQLQW